MLSNFLLSIVTVASTMITLASAGKQRTSTPDVYCNFQCPTSGRTDTKAPSSALVSTNYLTMEDAGTFTCEFRAKGTKTSEKCIYSGVSGYLQSTTANLCPTDALPAYFQCMKPLASTKADAWEEEMVIQVKRRAGQTLGPGGDNLKRMIHSARANSFERKKGIAEMKKRAMRDERSKSWH